MPARIWLVEYVAEAVQDFQAIEARKERISVLTVVDKLVALGPALQPPHVKSLKGEANLMELRKSQFDDDIVTARARAAKYNISLGR